MGTNPVKLEAADGRTFPAPAGLLHRKGPEQAGCRGLCAPGGQVVRAGGPGAQATALSSPDAPLWSDLTLHTKVTLGALGPPALLLGPRSRTSAHPKSNLHLHLPSSKFPPNIQPPGDTVTPPLSPTDPSSALGSTLPPPAHKDNSPSLMPPHPRLTF